MTICHRDSPPRDENEPDCGGPARADFSMKRAEPFVQGRKSNSIFALG
jgi:hypothetical protein